MLHSIDRIQIATFDAEETANAWERHLDAEPHAKADVQCLSAKRTSHRLGRGFVEFLEPDGEGPVQEALRDKGRPHLFAAGATSAELDAVARHLKDQNVPVEQEGDQLFVHASSSAGVNMRLVISAQEERPSVGLIDYMYEVTLLVDDGAGKSSTIASLFGLDSSHFSKIRSENFGYDGQLTLFRDGELHRFEVIAPFDREKTMGRFHERHGESYYMCFSETPHMLEIERRATDANAGITVERPDGRGLDQMADQMWLHPSALGGVMMGLSRPSMAWRWSGRPDWVKPL